MAWNISIGGVASLIIGAGAPDLPAVSRYGVERMRPARDGRPDSAIAS